MKKSPKIGFGILLVSVAIALCILCCLSVFIVGGIAYLSTSLNTSTTPIVLEETTKEPLPIGSEVNYYKQTVKIDEYEFSGSYITEENITQEPPEGSKYLWIHITARNDETKPISSPTLIEFTLIYQSKEIDHEIIYLDRPGYNNLGRGEIMPGKTHEGWLQFTVPNAAEADQIIVMFKPYLEYSDIYFLWKLVP
jgi:hypothetical protein